METPTPFQIFYTVRLRNARNRIVIEITRDDHVWPIAFWTPGHPAVTMMSPKPTPWWDADDLQHLYEACVQHRASTSRIDPPTTDHHHNPHGTPHYKYAALHELGSITLELLTHPDRTDMRWLAPSPLVASYTFANLHGALRFEKDAPKFLRKDHEYLKLLCTQSADTPPIPPRDRGGIFDGVPDPEKF